MSMYLGNKKVALTKVIVDKQPELNIQYGTDTPTDTSKLWAKTANTPSKVSFRNVFNGAYDGWQTTKISEFENKLYYSRGSLFQNYIYIFGGTSIDESSSTIINTIQKYDINTNTITTLSVTLPTAISRFGIATIGNYVYLIGGSASNGGVISNIRKFNCVSETFESLSTLLPNGMTGIACAAVGADIYLFGGNLSGGSNPSSIYKFDTLTNTISSVATLTNPKSNINACAVGTNIYLFGGSGNYSNIRKFDTLANTLTELSTKLPFNYGTAPSIAVGTDIYIISGAASTGNVTAILKFDTLSETITTLNTTTPEVIYSNILVTDGLNIYSISGTTTNNYKYEIQYTLQANELQLIETYDTTPLPFITSDSLELNVSIGKAFIGNSDNHAEAVEVYQYQNNSWVKVVS